MPISILEVIPKAFLNGKASGHITASIILHIAHLGNGVRNTIVVYLRIVLDLWNVGERLPDIAGRTWNNYKQVGSKMTEKAYYTLIVSKSMENTSKLVKYVCRMTQEIWISVR